MEKIDGYLAVSGAKPKVRAQFDRVVGEMPSLSSDSYTAACQVSDALERGQFSYNPTTFAAQDVLDSRRYNCLGKPLLMASILAARGIDSGISVVVNPHDAYFPDMENALLRRIEADTKYDCPILATKESSTRDYRFCPLEHLVLELNGASFETTSEDHKLRGCESRRDIGFDKALSFVLKDRATYQFKDGNFDNAIKLANEGLRIWPDNREIHGLLSCAHEGAGHSHSAGEHRQEYERIGGDDSHFYFQRFLQTGDSAFLDRAIKKNPTFAMAIGFKAREVESTDPREARFLYSLASQLYANSYTLDLPDFYITHKDSLGKLFGKEKISRILGGFVENGKT